MSGAVSRPDVAADATVSRRAFLVGGALALTAAGAYAATPRRAEHRLARHKLGDLVPRVVGPWTAGAAAGVVTATEELENKDGYDQLLTRTYQAAGLPSIMLLVAYGSTQGGTLQLHRPETCYPGQGFALDGFADARFSFPGAEVHARRFTARRDERVERLVYWTRIARRFPLNTAEEYAAIFGSVVTGVVPDGVLVRLSTVDADGDAADRALDGFLQRSMADAGDLGRRVLIGAA